jgi:hypothetical protein
LVRLSVGLENLEVRANNALLLVNDNEYITQDLKGDFRQAFNALLQ